MDLGVFGGTAVLALGLVALRHLAGWQEALSIWGFLLFVVGVDVAHVWSTTLRTYLDGQELRRHPLRYALVPLCCWAVGAALHHAGGAMLFWRCLAYLALFHFVRQQVGWAAVYRARAGQHEALDRWVDDAALYTSTLVPVLHWHARLDTTRFAWFVQGDFVDPGEVARAAAPPATALWAVCLAAFLARQAWLLGRTRVLHTGKLVVVVTTAACWWTGIVLTNSDFDFTVTNVLIHGVPYFALLLVYARERQREAPSTLGSRLVAAGLGTTLGALLLVAFVEELLWDRYLWQEHTALFGSGSPLSGAVAPWVVPLLALPQATHYALDGLLWRRSDTRERPAQQRALGFRGPPEAAAERPPTS